LVIISQKNEGFFVNMSCVVTRGYIKRMEQNLEFFLGVGYLKKATKEILPFWMVAVGGSMPNVKMERPLED
jgi:hypothetical protein